MELASALKQNEEGALATALERAAATGLNTGLVQEAQRRLDGLRRASDLEAQLDAASGPQPAGAPLLPQLQLLAKLLAEARLQRPCTMHHAPCTTHHAQCTMHHAPCIMHHAPCIMHHASSGESSLDV